MEDYNGYETVKEKLILAGISELQKHSIEDLSLRRVASICNVSSAAPYKHFKNKEDFISEVILYINHRWTQLRSHIIETYKENEKIQLIEICMAYIKFSIANQGFRDVLVMKTNDPTDRRVQENFYFSENKNLIRKYCAKKFKTEEIIEKKTFIIHSIVYGTIYMIDKEHLENSKETIDKARLAIEEELE